MKSILFVLCLTLSTEICARTLEVGSGMEFSSLQAAASEALPGDTIFLHPGNHSPGQYITGLQGTSEQWITIRSEAGTAIFSGQTEAIHLTDPAYLRIEGLTFEGQTGNGVNIDDGGSYDTPAHHVVIYNCTWRNMNATGNNDELKLSGLDDFIVESCTFRNGATNGSLVDMVGCHRGIFRLNRFENGGSNSIQAKGGTKDIIIVQNIFDRGGERGINIGGSTGLAFFRPIDANYEASNIHVYSNIFKGGTAAIAYVGAVNSEVVNNTIVYPTRWAVRILQENTEAGFLPSGHNSFINNIVIQSSTQPAINIGGNTSPETFTFTNNLWYQPGNTSWVPNTPVNEPGRILGMNPIVDTATGSIAAGSPAIASGADVPLPQQDHNGRAFASPRSIGAVEGAAVNVTHMGIETKVSLSPNPASEYITINIGDARETVTITNMRGVGIWNGIVDKEIILPVAGWAAGPYLVKIGSLSRVVLKLNTH